MNKLKSDLKRQLKERPVTTLTTGILIFLGILKLFLEVKIPFIGGVAIGIGGTILLISIGLNIYYISNYGFLKQFKI